MTYCHASFFPLFAVLGSRGYGQEMLLSMYLPLMRASEK